MNERERLPDPIAGPPGPGANGAHPTEHNLDLYALFPEALVPEESRPVADHLPTCPTCQARVLGLRARRDAAVRFLASDEGQGWYHDLRFSVEEAIGPEAQVGENTPIAVGPLLDLFFPDGLLHDTIKRRLADQTLAKVALGGVCLDFLDRQPFRRPFIESGSTPALAFQAIIRHWRDGGPLPRTFLPRTNNFLLNPSLWATANVSSRLLYGNRSYNPKYAGCFPVSERVIRRAFAGNDEAEGLVDDAWRDLHAKVRAFDVLFMTASKFHFFCGGFVGSTDNALLKTAFFSGCRATVVLIIDGSKLLGTPDLHKELQACIQVCDADFDNPSCDRAFKAVFPRQPIPEELVALRYHAAQRNPCVRLNLRRGNMRYKTTNGRFRRGRIVTPNTWADCVDRLLRENGRLWICISEPRPAPAGVPFAETLREAVEESNACFERFRSKVRVGKPERVVVGVNPRTLAFDPQGAEAVTVWKCPMVLVDSGVPALVGQ